MVVIELADLAAVIVILIIMLATFVVGKMLVAAIPSWHIPGLGNIHDKAASAVNATLHGLDKALDATLGATFKFVHSYVKFIGELVQSYYDISKETYGTLEHLFVHVLPRYAKQAFDYTKNEIVKIEGKIAHAVTEAEHYALSHVEHLATRLAHAVAHLEAYATHKVEALAKTVATDISNVEQYAVNKAHAAEVAAKSAATAALNHAIGAVDNSIGAVKADLQSLTKTVGAEITDIDNTIKDLVAGSAAGVIDEIDKDIEAITAAGWSTLSGQVSALQGVIGTDFPAVGEWLESIPTSAVTDVAGVASLAVAAVGIATKLAEDCTVPQCRNLGGLSSLFHDLTGLFEAGGVTAFLVELARDPQGFSTDVENILQPVATVATNGIRDLLGV